MTNIRKKYWKLSDLPETLSRGNVYHEITDEELYQILQTDLKDFRHFLEEIGQFLESQQKK